MLGSGKVVKAVADFLASEPASRSANRPGRGRLPNIVLDPILKSSSRAQLLGIRPRSRLLVERLIPLADVVTPNVEEAEAITGMKVRELEEMKAASAKLHEMGAPAVVITGGHLEKATDLLSFTTKRGVEQEDVRGRAAALELDSWHRVCLRHRHGLPSGARPGFGRSRPAGENLCSRRHLLRTPAGPGLGPCIIFIAWVSSAARPEREAKSRAESFWLAQNSAFSPRYSRREGSLVFRSLVLQQSRLVVIATGRFLEQFFRHERGRGRQQPFRPVKLDRLPVDEGLCREQTDQHCARNTP